MATYKNELEKIEAQEKQLNAQKKQLAQQKRNLKKKLAEQKAENEAKTAESTKQWFIDYCSKFNIECTFDEGNRYDVYITVTGKNGLKVTEGMYLEQHFTANHRSELESIVDEFYNIATAIDALSNVLDLSEEEEDENDAVRLTMYTTNRGYHAQFDTIYSDISALIKYNNGTVLVTVIYDEGDIRDTIIKLADGVELVMDGMGYDAVYMEIQKTVKVKTNKLDTLVDEVKKVVNQIKKITVEDN